MFAGGPLFWLWLNLMKARLPVVDSSSPTRFCSPWTLLVLFADLLLSACGEDAGVEPNLAPVVLARVDSVEITDLDFEEAIESLTGGRPLAATQKECRQKLQLLIDRQLLLLEVKKQGFYEDPEVMRQVEQWEREQLVLALQEAETGFSTSQWEEEELHEFFSGAGATRELRVGRLVFADSVRAAGALDDARRGLPFAELTTLHADGADAYVIDSGWLNLLALTDRRLVSLFPCPWM